MKAPGHNWGKCWVRLGWIFLVFPFSNGVWAADWPQYRGPNGDGSSPEMIRTNWEEQPPEVLWRKPIGPGFSSMAVSGGRVFTQERRTVNGAEREFCVCLDADTGEEHWATDVDVASYTDLSGYDERMDGPRSTPTIDGEYVYVFTSQLKLYCLRADNGDEVWKRDFPEELGSPVIAWQNCASPLVVDDLIFVNSNANDQSLMAVRKSDGTTAWSGENDDMTHSTPVAANLEDVPQVIFLTRAGLVSVVPESGTILWRLGFSPSPTSTAASPVVAGQYVHASAAYASGTWVAQVQKSGDGFLATELYRNRGNTYQIHWSTPVHHEGFIYAVPSPSSGQARLVCLDVEAGVNRWEQQKVGSGNIGFGTLIKAANALIVLTEAGELVLVEPNPDAYTEVAKSEVLEIYCWNNVALSEGRIYARSTSPGSPEMVAVDVSAVSAPLPAIGLAAERLASDGGFKLVISALDGTNLDAGHAGRLELLTASEITTPLDQWTVLNDGFTVMDGNLVIEISFGSEGSRYLLVREKE